MQRFAQFFFSNRLREPIKNLTGWIGISHWYPPAVSAFSCMKNYIVAITFTYQIYKIRRSGSYMKSDHFFSIEKKR